MRDSEETIEIGLDKLTNLILKYVQSPNISQEEKFAFVKEMLESTYDTGKESNNMEN